PLKKVTGPLDGTLKKVLDPLGDNLPPLTDPIPDDDCDENDNGDGNFNGGNRGKLFLSFMVF
ncbi:hypothetical protein AVEN_198174-1, partial [Araneus ventricosus]